MSAWSARLSPGPRNLGELGDKGPEHQLALGHDRQSFLSVREPDQEFRCPIPAQDPLAPLNGRLDLERRESPCRRRDLLPTHDPHRNPDGGPAVRDVDAGL